MPFTPMTECYRTGKDQGRDDGTVTNSTGVLMWRTLNENMFRFVFSKTDLMKSWRRDIKDTAEVAAAEEGNGYHDGD